jgi:tRNA pseudouridine38-40 synthase
VIPEGDRPPLIRYRAVVAYDGRPYCGWQRQAGDTPSVQGAIEAALAQVTGQPVTVLAAGRTDTGVHATGQVIAFDAAWRHTPDAFQRALNANLPGDIALQALERATAGFHPRYDARSRMYLYSLYAAPVRQPWLELRAWQVPVDLDGAAMQAAAALLVGRHDFAAFGRPPQGDNSVREVLRSEWIETRDEVSGTRLMRYRIEANAFLFRMVRRIVGALVRVGAGHLALTDIAQALAAAECSWPVLLAPAHGLCLIAVTY